MPCDTVQAAFSAHLRDPVGGKFCPKPAHLIEQIALAQKMDGRPGAEEAWALSLAAKDEAETVVWTRECAQAWALCKPVMDLGDDVGARMAFREAYTRLVAEARARREPVAWEVSEGFDPERRRVAVCAAVDAGRVNPGHHLTLPNAGHTLLLGLTGATKGVPQEIQERLQALRQQFADGNPPRPRPDDTPSRKQAQAARVAEYIKSKNV